MIEVFKILHHMYDSSVAPELIRNTSATRGNKYKLLNNTFHYSQKIFFCCTYRKYMEQLHYLKRLDKYWADMNVMFDWTADITGTGDRSESEMGPIS